MSATEWKAPGPGSWMSDDNHYRGTVSPFLISIMQETQPRALGNGFRRYGLLMESVRLEVVNHRLFFQPRFVGAPEPKEGKIPSPPPKALIRLLCLVHPEMRRRVRATRAAFATKLWRADRERWRTREAPRFRARNRALGAVQPRALDDNALLAYFDECVEHFRDGSFVHFDNNLASSFPVGDWAMHACEWTGCSPAEAVAVLQGANPSSAATMELLAPLAHAVARSPEAVKLVRGSGDPAARLGRLRETSSDVAQALEQYLEEHGDRIVTGFDVTDRTLAELPNMLLSSIAAQLNAGERPHPPASAHVALLRERVPEPMRARYDELLEEARAAYGLHDEDVGLAWMWPLGLLRRVLVAIGERLETRGSVKDAEHVCECSLDEVRALLRGADAPAATELAQRADERRSLEGVDPPAMLGPPLQPPPKGTFPEECERMMNGLMFYLTNMNTETEPPADGRALRGTPASRGRFEGRARVVSGPADFDRIERGDVLVAGVTSPAYNVVLPMLGAVVTDRGGALCHAAIVAREFGIPAVVGTRTATSDIPDGARIVVDGDAGTVSVLS